MVSRRDDRMTSTPAVDVLRPFQLDRSLLRGRFVRLGDTVDYVLRAHDYPQAVSDLLGELLVLAGALAGGLKFAGTFSLQVRSDGPVRLLVADCTNEGRMRGWASFDAEGVAAAETPAAFQLLGKGLLALTVDQSKEGGETYQGIVDLSGDSLASCMLNYFHRSEQVPTGIRVAIGRDSMTDRWQAGAIVVQATPGARPEDGGEATENWQRTMLLLLTARDEELLDPGLQPDDLLYRLFHEEDVRVYRPLSLVPGCSCDEERVVAVLKSFDVEDVAEMREPDGGITVTCQFCNRSYRFDEARLRDLLGQRSH